MTAVDRGTLARLAEAARAAVTEGWPVTKPSPEVVLALLASLAAAEQTARDNLEDCNEQTERAERAEAERDALLGRVYALWWDEAQRGLAAGSAGSSSTPATASTNTFDAVRYVRELIASNQDYQRTHGHYIVPLSERLLQARADVQQLRDAALEVADLFITSGSFLKDDMLREAVTRLRALAAGSTATEEKP